LRIRLANRLAHVRGWRPLPRLGYPAAGVYLRADVAFNFVDEGTRIAMTVPRLLLIAFACFVFIDLKFGGGRTLDAIWDHARSLGYWLNSEFQSITYKIARH